MEEEKFNRKEAEKKIRLIYLPFVLWSLGTIVGYGLFRWVFAIKLAVLPLDEMIFSYWIPVVLTGGVVFLFLRKRTHLLKFEVSGKKGAVGTQLLMWVVMLVPLVISQSYLEKAGYSLQEVQTVAAVEKLPNEKYFSIKNYDVDWEFNGIHIVSKTTSHSKGERSTYFRNYYSVCPFQKSTQVWFGVRYQEGSSKQVGSGENLEKLDQFLEESEQDFKNYSLTFVTYFEKVFPSEEKEGFLEATRIKSEEVLKDVIILKPLKEDFAKRAGNYLPYFFAALVGGNVLMFLLVLMPKFDDHKLALYEIEHPPK